MAMQTAVEAIAAAAVSQRSRRFRARRRDPRRFRRLVELLRQGIAQPRVGAQIGQRLGRRGISPRHFLDDHFLDDAGKVGGHPLKHLGDFRQAAVRGRVPHHPGDLLVAAEGPQAGKERLELRPHINS